MIFGLTVFHLWIDWFILWAIPVVFLFQVSMAINILPEHRWPADPNSKQRDLANVCYGRFCGERAPHTQGLSATRAFWLWMIWWIRVVVIYLPYRLFVLVGDEPQHDLHHRLPKSDWANAKFARATDGPSALVATT